MKNLTMSLTIAVTALVAAAGSASAQSYKAEIPMAFRAGGKVMAPGSYDLRLVKGASGHAFVAVRNLATSATAVLAPFRGSDAPEAWLKSGNPKISFDCAGATCSLSRLWTGQDASTYQFPAPKVSRAGVERMAVVTFGLTKTD